MESIFGSKSRVKLLTLFLLNPGRKYYVREIERLTRENINSIRRELKNLEAINLLKSQRSGNQKYYTVNQEMSIYPELKNIFLKTQGAAKILQKKISSLKGINTAFIYGSYAKGEAGPDSDIDIIIIGNVNEDDLIMRIRNVEKELNREINYVLFTPEEYETRKKKKDPFIKNVLNDERIILLGEEP
ncbi:nucleotidyltransferase domain protein [archaeon BMS3Abin16]|nr:nucleotidyltransferase domain protein [archaeon BMS3Abin16]GBE56612.1 nucleotidyltransferase domain protein [archaeon BMS3Bbin16]